MTVTTWFRRGAVALAALLMLALAVGMLTSDDRSRGAAAPMLMTQRDDHGPRREALSSGGQLRTRGVTIGGPASSDPVAGSAAQTIPSIGDRIVRTVDLAIEVDRGTFEGAWREAHDVATRAGGQVLSAARGDARGDGAIDPDEAFGSIVLRVPADKLEAAGNALRSLGTVRGDATSSEDVTQEYVDLQSRVRHLRAEEAVLLRLFDRARTISDTLEVQNRLSAVQQQIEQLTGRIRFLDARTRFATISLRLAERNAGAFGGSGEPSWARAWDTALEGLVRIGTAAMIGLLWLSPFALAAAAWLMVRRRPRDTVVPPA